MKIKTGDNVRILAGKDKGKTGKVVQVFAKKQLIVVDGLNLAFKHLRAGKGQEGKKVEYPAPMHISNVALEVKDGVAGRVGYTVSEKAGKRVKNRIVRKAGKELS